MGLVDAINNLISEHGSAAILRDHLALLKTQAEALEKEVTELKREKMECEEVSRRLQRELSAKAKSAEYEEARGGHFKRKPGGGYHSSVYCPSCHNPMGSLEGFLPYNCGKCNIVLDFNGNALKAVMLELPE